MTRWHATDRSLWYKAVVLKLLPPVVHELQLPSAPASIQLQFMSIWRRHKFENYWHRCIYGCRANVATETFAQVFYLKWYVLGPYCLPLPQQNLAFGNTTFGGAPYIYIYIYFYSSLFNGSLYLLKCLLLNLILV